MNGVKSLKDTMIHKILEHYKMYSICKKTSRKVLKLCALLQSKILPSQSRFALKSCPHSSYKTEKHREHLGCKRSDADAKKKDRSLSVQ